MKGDASLGPWSIRASWALVAANGVFLLWSAVTVAGVRRDIATPLARVTERTASRPVTQAPGAGSDETQRARCKALYRNLQALSESAGAAVMSEEAIQAALSDAGCRTPSAGRTDPGP